MIFTDIITRLDKELATIQAGRVNASVLDDIQVEVYGTRSPLQQVATITNQGPQNLIIQPWDPSIVKDIERAIRTCGRDYNPAVDGTSLRLPFPSLTEEKRRSLVAIVQNHVEEAHVAVKRLREELMNDLKKQKADKTLSEDQFFAKSKGIQKDVDDCNKTIDEHGERKSKQLLTI